VAAFHQRPLQDHYRVLVLGGVVLKRKTGAGALARPVLVAQSAIYGPRPLRKWNLRLNDLTVCGNLSGVVCGARAPRHDGYPRAPVLTKVSASRAVRTCQNADAPVPPLIHQSPSHSQTEPTLPVAERPATRDGVVRHPGTWARAPARSRRSAPACWRAPPPGRSGASAVTPLPASARSHVGPR
jgi:hypothetical protein